MNIFRYKLRHIAGAGGYRKVCALALCCSVATFAGEQLTGQNRLKVKPLTPEEERLRLTTKIWQPATPLTRTSLPSYIDNSRSTHFPEVFNQGSNNSCSQAAGVRYAYSFEVNRQLGREASKKENVFCYHFTWNFLNDGENQGSHAFLGYDLMKDCGTVNLARWDDAPYSFPEQTRWLSGAQSYIDAMQFRVKDYTKINLKTREGIDLLRRFLYDHGDGSPVGGVATISYQTDDWGYRRYDGPGESRIGYIVTKEGKDGPHAITVTGYDDSVEYDFDGDGKIDEDEKGAFIFINSWGEDWGSEGRCLLPYSVVLADTSEGGLKETDAEAYMVQPEISSPTLVFIATLQYNRRNELSFYLGAADGEDAKSPQFETQASIMRLQGGANPMQGWNASEEMEVAFNFSRFRDKISGFENPTFFLSVRRTAASGTGILKSFKVVDLVTGAVYTSDVNNLLLSGGITVMTTGRQKLSAYPSCSPWLWIEPGTKRPKMNPFVVRTASGKLRKLKINGYDAKTGTLTIKHAAL